MKHDLEMFKEKVHLKHEKIDKKKVQIQRGKDLFVECDKHIMMEFSKEGTLKMSNPLLDISIISDRKKLDKFKKGSKTGKNRFISSDVRNNSSLFI